MSEREFDKLKQQLHDPDSQLANEERQDPERYKAQKISDVAEALQEGKLPTTEQVAAAVDKLEEENVIGELTKGLSASGRKVGADVEKALETGKELLLEKNRGELLQRLIWYGNRAAHEIGAHDEEILLSSDVQELLSVLRLDLKESIDRIVSLVQLVATNSQFRSILGDIATILQDALYSQVDQTETGQQTIEADKQTKGRIEQTAMKQGFHPHSYAEAVKENLDEAKVQAKDVLKSGLAENHKPLSQTVKEGVDIASQKVSELVPEHVQGKAKSVAQKTYRETQQAGKPIGDVAKDLARDVKEQAGRLDLPEDIRNEIIDKMRDALSVLQRNPDLNRGLHDLFEVASDLMSKANEALDSLRSKSDTTASLVKSELEEVNICAKQLLENLANNTSLNPLLNALGELQDKVLDDKEFNLYLKDLKKFIREAGERPERSVLGKRGEQNEFYHKFNNLVSRGRDLVFDKYGPEVSRVSDCASQFLDALRQDDLTSEFTSEIQTLVKDLVLDDQGRPTVKFDLVQDLAKIVPKIAQKLGYLPLPKIENDDEDYHYILDNIVIKCTNIVPKYLHITTDLEVDSTRPEGEQSRQIIKLTLSKVQASARDIAFYYNKKTGLLQPADVGLLDIDINGEDGVTLHVVLEPFLSALPGQSVFRIRYVETTIEDLSLRLHKTHHDIMYKLLQPLIKNYVRRNLEEQISLSVTDLFSQLDAKLAETAKNVSETLGITSETRKHIGMTGLPEWGSKAFNVEE